MYQVTGYTEEHMSTKPKLLAGAKTANKHTTMTKETENVVQILKKEPTVTRVIVSRIIPVGKTDSGKIKVRRLSNALEVSIKGSGAVQLLYVYGTDWDKVCDILTWISTEP